MNPSDKPTWFWFYLFAVVCTLLSLLAAGVQ